MDKQHSRLPTESLVHCNAANHHQTRCFRQHLQYTVSSADTSYLKICILTVTPLLFRFCICVWWILLYIIITLNVFIWKRTTFSWVWVFTLKVKIFKSFQKIIRLCQNKIIPLITEVVYAHSQYKYIGVFTIKRVFFLVT